MRVQFFWTIIIFSLQKMVQCKNYIVKNGVIQKICAKIVAYLFVGIMAFIKQRKIMKKNTKSA